MNTEEQTKFKRKPKLGLIGFIFVLCGFFSLGLMALPGLIICLIAVFRKGNRIFASIGLILTIPFFTWFLSFTLADSVPFPLRLIKYYTTGPTFWIRYDKSTVCDVQSQYLLFGGSYNAAYLKSQSPYDINDIVAFAKKHGWKLKSREQIKKASFIDYLRPNGKLKKLNYSDFVPDETNDVNFEENERRYKAYENVRGIAISGTFWITQDCDVLTFDTGNEIGCASFVVVSNDQKEMAIYWNGFR